MRVSLQTEGGIGFFPGLSKDVAVDTEDLQPGDATELRRLVADAQFFSLPSVTTAPARGAADYKQYTITVEDGSKRHTVSFADPSDTPRLSALRDFVRSKAS